MKGTDASGTSFSCSVCGKESASGRLAGTLGAKELQVLTGPCLTRCCQQETHSLLSEKERHRPEEPDQVMPGLHARQDEV